MVPPGLVHSFSQTFNLAGGQFPLLCFRQGRSLAMTRTMGRKASANINASDNKTTAGSEEFSENSDVSVDVRSEFGVGKCRPRSLQCLSSIWAFVGFWSPCALFLMSVEQYMRSQVISLERAFSLNSSSLGLLLSFGSIGNMCFVLIGSHFGKFYHIPRLLSVSAALTGVILVGISLIHVGQPTALEAPPAAAAQGNGVGGAGAMGGFAAMFQSYLCRNTSSLAFMGLNSSMVMGGGGGGGFPSPQKPDVKVGLYVFMVLLFLTGAFRSYTLPLATNYVELNGANRGQSGITLGTIVTTAVFGAPVGLLLGGAMSSTPVDLSETSMQLMDPRWVGAWWLGFVIIAFCLLLVSVPVICLPRYIRHKTQKKKKEGKKEKGKEEKGKEDKKKKDNSTIINGEKQNDKIKPKISLKETEDLPPKTKTEEAILDKSPPRDTSPNDPDPSLAEKLKEWPRSLKRLLTSPLILLLLVEGFFNFVAMTGAVTFNFKYIENQFNVPAATASYTLGMSFVVTLAVGTFLGGCFITRFQMSSMAMFKVALLTQLITLAVNVPLPFLTCDDSQIHGLTYFPSSNTTKDLGCSCAGANQLFVCGDDGRTYVSPCEAGCTGQMSLTFTQCGRVGANGTGTVFPGVCPDPNCDFFIPFVVILNVMVLIGSMGFTPRILMVVRCVADKDRSMVNGILNGFIQTLASILSPIIFGAIYDKACVLWPPTGGACALYSKKEVAWTYFGSVLVTRAIGTLFLVAATILKYRIHRREQLLDAEINVGRNSEDSGVESRSESDSTEDAQGGGARVDSGVELRGENDSTEGEVGENGQYLDLGPSFVVEETDVDSVNERADRGLGISFESDDSDVRGEGHVSEDEPDSNKWQDVHGGWVLSTRL
ncbi:solute carrier organic anion transporter family member 3A1 [Aplysia californica]|uniref:Solute carrier organic anion transporter family member 3A1 n=1 Tax=Aplysia californica TaxID=6500 RepID=A0ABM0K2K6_APLCA|nr:solute carrier organic anion transporter family member 3A1 [Aplysia californica]